MKKGYHDYEPLEEGEVPSGWTPESDKDQAWQTIARLAREADRPTMPAPAHFAAIREEIRRELRTEGLIHSDTTSAGEIGFGAWLKLVLSGGGTGAQAFRLGLAASVAFAIGLQFASKSGESTSQPSRNVAALADEPAPMAGAASTHSRSAVQATPAPVSNQAPARMGSGYGGIAIDKSILDEDAAASWKTTAPAGAAWEFANAPVNTVAVGTAPAGSQEQLLEQALENLQVLKFSSLVEQDEGNLAHIRRVEQALSQMIAPDEASGRAPRADALERYRRAEQALAAQRYHMAMQTFEEAALAAPGSSLAFLAQFQIGRIAYEKTQDYDLALESFQRCLGQNYAEDMPAEYRRYIEERVEILRAGEADDWRSLSHWHAAQSAMTPVQATKNLVDVVMHGPSNRLAADAAERLKDIVIADSTQRTIDHRKVAEALRKRVNAERSSPYAARIQLALAEIEARRSQNLGQALLDYRKALELNPDEQTKRNIRSRMTVIMNYRLTGLPSVE